MWSWPFDDQGQAGVTSDVGVPSTHLVFNSMEIFCSMWKKILYDNVYISILHVCIISFNVYMTILHVYIFKYTSMHNFLACVYNYLAYIHRSLACIHNHLARIHNYVACIHDYFASCMQTYQIIHVYIITQTSLQGHRGNDILTKLIDCLNDDTSISASIQTHSSTQQPYNTGKFCMTKTL